MCVSVCAFGAKSSGKGSGWWQDYLSFVGGNNQAADSQNSPIVWARLADMQWLC